MKFIPNAITKTIGRQILTTQKHSPRILFVVGVAGVVTSTVLACKATLKLTSVLDDAEYEIEAVKKDLVESEKYNTDLAYVYVKNAGKVLKLYAPALVVGSVSVGALTGAHVTLTRRNAGLTAAYAATAKAYDDYRERVKEKLGEEKERDIYHAASVQTIEDENGKPIKATISDPNKFSPYAKFFDEYNVNWVKNPELNRLFVQCQQNYANHLLHSRGHVFLNEVYDMLGIDRTEGGAVVGWAVSDVGDNFIDFGMFEAGNKDFINGGERSIILDFNVDGVIYNLIG